MKKTFSLWIFVVLLILTTTVPLLSLSAFTLSKKNTSNNLPKNKILVLIVASDELVVYSELQKIWRSYMHLDPTHVEAYFVKANPQLTTSCMVEGDVIWARVDHGFNPGMVQKTLMSMELMLPRLNEFDYVIRTNLSSFYFFPTLFKFLGTLPRNGCYCAHIDIAPDYFVPAWGCGAGIIFSPDIIKLLVQNQNSILNNPNITTSNDDLIIAEFLQNRKIRILSAPREDILTSNDWRRMKEEIPQDAFHFRVKNPDPELRLSDDIYVHTELLKRYYPAVQVPKKLGYFDKFMIASHPSNDLNTFELKILHHTHCLMNSDINEHLPLLRSLAAECSNVTEIGLRDVVSTWSLLLGLSENPYKPRSYTGIDIISPKLESLLLAKKLSEANDISFKFIQDNDMNIDIEPTDLLFIDSLHTYAHLSYELETFSPKVEKYIAVHDTSDPWGLRDDTEYHGDYSEYPAEIDRTKRGLWLAILDFLMRHPEWTMKERHLNNHGLIVLQRR